MATRAASRTTRPQEGGTVLHLEGVDAPVRARVLGRTERHVTVEQALPFLRLDSQVLEGAERAARIQRIAVGFDEGIPRLIMELRYDRDQRDATVPYGLATPDANEAVTHAAEAGLLTRSRQPTLRIATSRAAQGAMARDEPQSTVWRRAGMALVSWLAQLRWWLARLSPKRA